MALVCDSIHTSLNGIKKWTAWYYMNDIDKYAYLDSFEECQRLVKKHDMNPEAMLQALSDYHDFVLTMAKPPFFSRARWTYAPLDARNTAVRVAFQLVDGISKRYLP